MDVTESPEGISVSWPFLVYFFRADLDAAIRAVAQRYQAWWDGLSADEQAVDDRITANNHFRASIGRAWADKPFDNILAIHRGSLQTTVNARDAENWYLGNLEQWAYERGFDAFVTALAVGNRRTALNAQLDAHTICHLDADADIRERLINPGDGFTDDEWAEFSGAHFNDAAGTSISVVTEADKTAESNAQIVIVSTATVKNPVGDTTYLWEQVSGETVTIHGDDLANALFQAPTLEIGDDPAVLEFRITATNNGESASDTITVTINPPVSD